VNGSRKVIGAAATYYTYNAANQLVTESTGDETIYYSYDDCGNMVARQGLDATAYYQYDTESHMMCIDFGDGGHSYFAYDADAKRVSQRTAEGLWTFVYREQNLLKFPTEKGEDGETVAQYTMGMGRAAGLDRQHLQPPHLGRA